MKSVFLVVTSALALSGEIAKVGDVIEVTEREAVNFLDRGKARLATADDGVDVGPTDDEILAAMEAEEAAVKTANPKKEKAK